MKYFIFILLVLQISCSTLEVTQPMPTIESPAITPANKFSFAFGTRPARSVSVTTSANRRPPTFSPTSIYNEQWKFKMTYGLNSWFDVGLGVGTSDSSHLKFGAYSLHTHLSLIGDAAKPSGLMLTLGGEYNYASNTISGDQAENFGNGGYPWKATAIYEGPTATASLGYAFSPGFILFTSGAYSWSTLKSDIKQDVSTTGDSAGGSYEYSLYAPSWSAGGGIDMGSDSFRLIPYGQWSEYEVGTPKLKGTYGGFWLKFIGS